MTSEQAGHIAQQIWDETPRENARVWLLNEIYDDYEQVRKDFFEGNREGLLRLAGELLSAVATGSASCDYLFCEGPQITRVVKTIGALPPASLQAPPSDPLWKKILAIGGCLSLLVFVLACIVVGFFTIVSRIF